MKIFAGNLSFDATEADIKNLFEGFGRVTSVVVVLDDKGKKSRGFCFLEMPDIRQAHSAMAALDGKEFMGRPMRVNPVRINPEKAAPLQPKVEKPRIPRRSVMRTVRMSATDRVAQPRHWEKKKTRAKPWEKREAGAKPWEKREAGAKPWAKREGRAKAKQFQKRKTGGYTK